MEHTHSLAHIKGRTFFSLLLAIIVIASIYVVAPYLNTLIIAFLLSFLAQPVYKYFLILFKGNHKLATSITVLIVIISLFVLIVVIGRIVVGQATEFANLLKSVVASSSSNENLKYERLLNAINSVLIQIPFLELQINDEDFAALLRRIAEPAGSAILNLFSGLGSISSNLAGFLGGIFTKLFIFIMTLATLIPNFDRFRSYLEKLSPLDNKVDELFIDRTLAMSKAMLKGSLIIAFVQGIISGLSFWIAGVPYTAFWTLIMLLLSVIPLGAGLISIPAGFILIALGNVPMGIFLILTNLLIVGNIDNVLRPELMPKEASIPSVLLLAGVFGGIGVFGVMGVVYGPVILLLLITGLETYSTHFRHQ